MSYGAILMANQNSKSVSRDRL